MAIVSRSDVWPTVILLSSLYAISAVDRLVLAVLGPSVRAAFRLDGAQLGALIGLSFSVVYAVSGLPVARAIDRHRRAPIVVAGVLLWSAATAASAFAPSYIALLGCRGAVAAGEAVLTPAAVSMIADLFPRDRRAAPTGFFVSTGSVAGLAAPALGGMMLAAAQALSPSVGLAPWRLTLLLLGALGLVGGVAFGLLVREPARTEADILLVGPAETGAALRLYAFLFSAVGAAVVLAYSLIAWLPSLLIARFGLAGPQAGYLLGLIGMVGGVAGMGGSSWLIGRMVRRGRQDAPLVVGLGLAAAAGAGLALMAVAASQAVFAVALGVMFGALSALTLLPSLVVQQAAPADRRGVLMATYLLIANLLGLGLGPVLTGELSDRFGAGPAGLERALIVVGATGLASAFTLLLLARRAFRDLVSGAEVSRP